MEVGLTIKPVRMPGVSDSVLNTTLRPRTSDSTTLTLEEHAYVAKILNSESDRRAP